LAEVVKNARRSSQLRLASFRDCHLNAHFADKSQINRIWQFPPNHVNVQSAGFTGIASKYRQKNHQTKIAVGTRRHFIQESD
jgi:hypothetical protein